MYPAFRPDFRHRAADLVRSLALVILAAFVAACSGDSGTPGGGSPSGTGSVGIFFTDSPSDEFDQILVTVEGIVLIGGGPQVTLFSGGATIDLKQIEKFSDLFVFADHVPARSYSKIRLNVSGIKLVNINDPDDEGDDDVIDVKVGGHKIDFVPRGKFEVHPGQALMLEIDMDADKMLKRTGNGKYLFTPVVFVNILHSDSPAKLARIHGVVVEIFEDETFELCTTVFLATPLGFRDDDGEDGGLGDRHKCFTVITDLDTGIFDENGDQIGFEELEVEDEATVIGRIRLVDRDGNPVVTPFRGDHDSDSDTDTDSDSDSDTDSDSDGNGHPTLPDFELVIDAIVIELGPIGTYTQLAGVVETEVDERHLFELRVEGDEASKLITTLVQPDTRIFSTEGDELDASEILPETLAKVEGVFGDADPEVFKAALILLDVMLLESEQLSGVITEIDADMRELVLVVISGDDVKVPECVQVPEEADILRLTSGDEATSLTERIGFEDLVEESEADVYGGFDDDDCFTADLLIVEATGEEPVPSPLAAN